MATQNQDQNKNQDQDKNQQTNKDTGTWQGGQGAGTVQGGQGATSADAENEEGRNTSHDIGNERSIAGREDS